ncbi:GOLD domain-containing protein [Psidium guajava]|nr:GOLD domain-containing protein [Psidium guajava]
MGMLNEIMLAWRGKCLCSNDLWLELVPLGHERHRYKS